MDDLAKQSPPERETYFIQAATELGLTPSIMGGPKGVCPIIHDYWLIRWEGNRINLELNMDSQDEQDFEMRMGLQEPANPETEFAPLMSPLRREMILRCLERRLCLFKKAISVDS